MKSSKELSMVKKVAIIGPESTGKSTLCKQLAAHYQTVWVPEYAREYLLKHGTSYTYDSLLEIAKGQVELEKKFLRQVEKEQWKEKDAPYPSDTENLSSPESPQPVKSQPPTSNPQHPILFIDTEMYVMKVWAEFVYGKCHQWIIDQIVERKYDLYLLCNIDLPWSPDILREYPDPEPRRKLFRMYHDILVNQLTPWTTISGDHRERLRLAINAINRIL